jgi:hypothetical protein
MDMKRSRMIFRDMFTYHHDGRFNEIIEKFDDYFFSHCYKQLETTPIIDFNPIE